ncbi:lipase family protein [Corynebacterium sp. MSK041]|uniref:lipase family protein n=1 Tax=Corynebacterium sp. MSK041 TaxID=3050194 RepID=UPI0025509C16|nr:lipase family protein [Corynebacterium sp. MSK041]MDK8794567.1 lipase family protein [Corynebacterium sp. MSK041]
MSTKKNRIIPRTVIAGALGAVATAAWWQTRKTGTHGLYIRTLLPLVVDFLTPRRNPKAPDLNPQWLAGQTNGELIRADEVRVMGLNSSMNSGAAWRIEYSTTDAEGRPLLATGLVIRSNNPWEGTGPRPVIAHAPGTQGTAAHCDPSHSLSVFTSFKLPLDIISAYEQPAINMFVAAGCHVVVTDYPRDPESGRQLYCNHVAGAHALYDAVRAARHLGIESETLGLFGFSQGGGTVAAAVEEPDYAGDLQPKAAVCGAPPSDFDAILEHVEAETASFVLPYALDGMMATEPAIEAELAPLLTDSAKELLELARNRCVLGAMPHSARQDTSSWIVDKRSLPEVIASLPATREAMDKMRLGSRPPRVHTRLWASVHDDIIPYSSTQKLADEWGIDLLTRRLFPLLRFDVGKHLIPFFIWMHDDVTWLIDNLQKN